jgi:O-methyltransferase domain/Dimerisation domain
LRPGLRPTAPSERIAEWFNLAPIPVGEAMFGMPMVRALQVAQKIGLFEELAKGAVSAPVLAERIGVKEIGLTRLLDVLVLLGHVELDREERYSLSARARKWLDPASESYVGGFIADTSNYWEWWAGLEDLVREGTALDMHDMQPDDPYWSSYITGQYELARLSSKEVAAGVALRDGAESLLDVAGAHGEFSMALCRRHDGLRATIVDLPGSARIGREIVAEAGMSERVSYLESDMFEAEFGGPHDGALLFNIVHHLDPEQAKTLFGKVSDALRPGAPICVLELLRRAPGEKPNQSALLGLFFHLTSGADTYSGEEMAGWMAETGFGPARTKTFRKLPGLGLLRAEKIA